MKKNDWKYLVNALLFVDICSIAIIGLIMGFVIPSGGGRGHETNYFLWLHRHEWGDIHLYLSLVLLVLIVLHVSFGWTWVVSSTKRYFGDKWQKVLLILSGAWVGVLFIGWLAKMV